MWKKLDMETKELEKMVKILAYISISQGLLTIVILILIYLNGR